MADPLTVVTQLLAPVVERVAGHPADPVVRPSDRADLQVNGALALAKTLGRPPRDVAAELLEAARPVLAGMIVDAEIAGPGFINLTLDPGYLGSLVAAVAADEHLGVTRVDGADAETVVVDYSAPNVAKEMHVGHLRSTVIGDCLVRVLEAVGQRVQRENHIGDWGTPFGMLIEHLTDLGEDAAAEELGVGDLDGFYKAARRKFDESPEFAERARHRVVMLQGGDAETLRLWRRLVAESANYFDAVYQRLGVRLEPGDIVGESAYNDLLPVVVDRLDDAGLLVTSDGAEVVFPPGFTNRDGDPLPLIIRKGDGGYNYASTDLACVIDRVERLGAQRIVYVVGAPQAQHLQMVFAVATQAGWLPAEVSAEHVAFGNVLGPDRKMLKSRAGDAVKLSALLDEAVERATAAVSEKNPELDPETRAIVARSVGIGAVKYSDLSNDRVKDYVFDWDRMLSFDGNTSPYLQYAHARICSIFRRAGIERSSVRGRVPALDTPAERTLALTLVGFDTAVADTAERSTPHRLCGYLYDLASAFTTFYEQCPVLKADGETQREDRLALCDATASVLERGLGLLGIDAPERM
jgi:arginyl-tRNA synthetase